MKKKPAGIIWHKIILNFAVMLILGSCIMPAELTELINDEAFKAMLAGGIRIKYEHPEDHPPEFDVQQGEGTIDSPLRLYKTPSVNSITIVVENNEDYDRFDWSIGVISIPSDTGKAYSTTVNANDPAFIGGPGMYQLSVMAKLKGIDSCSSADIYIKVVN